MCATIRLPTNTDKFDHISVQLDFPMHRLYVTYKSKLHPWAHVQLRIIYFNCEEHPRMEALFNGIVYDGSITVSMQVSMKKELADLIYYHPDNPYRSLGVSDEGGTSDSPRKKDMSIRSALWKVLMSVFRTRES